MIQISWQVPDVYTVGEVLTSTSMNKISGDLNFLFTQIYDSTLGVAAASFDITSIPATYSHLLLRLLLRGDASSVNVHVNCRVNNDSGSNYDYDTNSANGGVFQSLGSANAQATWYLGRATGGTATASYATAAEIAIHSYTQTTFYKKLGATGFYDNGVSSTNHGEFWSSGTWRGTAAVSRLTVYPDTGNWTAGSRATLYGII